MAMKKTPKTRNILGPPDRDTLARLISESASRCCISMSRREFRARWFAWRSALAVSLISGLTCEQIISGNGLVLRKERGTLRGYGSNLFFLERSMVIWICRTIGDISFTQIGAVVDRQNTSVMSAFRRADDAIASREPKYFDLLTDVLYLESNQLGPQKNNLIRSSRG